MLYRFIRAQPLLAALIVAGVAAVTVSSVEIARLSAQPRKLDVPYVPTPQDVVEAMLKLAAPRPDDFLVDLGCGDGRIPITAAKTYGTRGLGVDLNPQRIAEARANAVAGRVTDKVEFIEGDLFKTDFSKATILTLYLLPDVNFRLRPRILDMRPGTRVVSHDFDMADWKAKKIETFGTYKKVYFWVVPAKVQGRWKAEIDGMETELVLEQKFDDVAGSASRNGKVSGRLDGDRISLQLTDRDGRARKLEGRVTAAGTMEGSGWRAQRT
jgi:SAM-dependent methyltransferase